MMGKAHTHMTVADHEWELVALTATVNTGWGNKMVVPGTGVVLNDEMDDFSISPGVPNAFGWWAPRQNAIEPRKRPLSSLSPSMVLDSSGQPMLTCGAAGGPRIITATLQNIVRCIDLEMSMHQSISSSRLHHQWRPDYLSCEASLAKSLCEVNNRATIHLSKELKKLGHEVRIASSLAVDQGIEREGWVRPEGKNVSKRSQGPVTLQPACDPRARGWLLLADVEMPVVYFQAISNAIQSLIESEIPACRVDDTLDWIAWEERFVLQHALAKWESFRREMDASVFSLSGRPRGVQANDADLSLRDNFIPETTWLAVSLATITVGWDKPLVPFKA